MTTYVRCTGSAASVQATAAGSAYAQYRKCAVRPFLNDDDKRTVVIVISARYGRVSSSDTNEYGKLSVRYMIRSRYRRARTAVDGHGILGGFWNCSKLQTFSVDLVEHPAQSLNSS